MEMDNTKYESKRETFREGILIIVGLLLLVLWLFLDSTIEGVLVEVVSIMGWVAIWEATSISLINQPELFAKKKTYEKASNAQIIVEAPKSAEA